MPVLRTSRRARSGRAGSAPCGGRRGSSRRPRGPSRIRRGSSIRAWRGSRRPRAARAGRDAPVGYADERPNGGPGVSRMASDCRMTTGSFVGHLLTAQKRPRGDAPRPGSPGVARVSDHRLGFTPRHQDPEGPRRPTTRADRSPDTQPRVCRTAGPRQSDHAWCSDVLARCAKGGARAYWIRWAPAWAARRCRNRARPAHAASRRGSRP